MKIIKTEYLMYVVNFFVTWLIPSNGKLVCMLKNLFTVQRTLLKNVKDELLLGNLVTKHTELYLFNKVLVIKKFPQEYLHTFAYKRGQAVA